MRCVYLAVLLFFPFRNLYRQAAVFSFWAIFVIFVYFYGHVQYNRSWAIAKCSFRNGLEPLQFPKRGMIITVIDDKVFEGKSQLHFIGVGGSGMFPLVQIFLGRGYRITGSDNNESDTLALERSMGVTVYMGHRPENLEGADLVVYSAAIMQDNPELVAARERGLPVYERSLVLGYLTRRYDNCICVAGTHGKTTTTAMLTQILLKADMDPSAVIGGKLPLIGGNGRSGGSDIMTCEACEFVDTFLDLAPDIGVILNVDEDHLDYFKNLENIIRSFHGFAALCAKCVIVNGDDANSLQAVKGIEAPVITYGADSTNDYYPADIHPLSPTQTSFSLMHKGKKLCGLTVSVPGSHNLLNAVAACAAALAVGTSADRLCEGLSTFTGAGRRFEILGEVDGVTIADDYAHHPAELKVTLEVAKKMGYNRVWAVFQPFTYSRTALLLDDFARELSIADRVVMSEIMGSREINTYNIYTRDLAEKIPGSVWFPTFDEIADYVLANAQAGDLVITLGCGDVYKCAKLLLKAKKRPA